MPVKYPPLGKRSFGLGRAHNFGLNFDEYVQTINNRSIVVIQIEHIDALKNLDEILQVPGIDAIIIGPYDLIRFSWELPENLITLNSENAIQLIINQVKKSSVALGIHIVHPSKHELQEKRATGFTFIGLGMDSIFLIEESAQCSSLRKRVKTDNQSPQQFFVIKTNVFYAYYRYHPSKDGIIAIPG